jgi:dihydroorotate dehydrogenase
MPDWPDQPAFSPRLVLPVWGLSFFRKLATASPPRATAVDFAGSTFPSPVGLGSGIDVDGRAALLMKELGLGFLELHELARRS